MNSELKQKLIEWAESLAHVASEQIPEFASQIVAYAALKATIWMWVGILGFAFLAVLILLLVVCYFVDRHGDREIITACIGWLMVASLIPIMVIGCNFVTIKKCELAPKIVVLDYIKSG